MMAKQSWEKESKKRETVEWTGGLLRWMKSWTHQISELVNIQSEGLNPLVVPVIVILDMFAYVFPSETSVQTNLRDDTL